MQSVCFFDCYKDKSGTWESLIDDSLVSGNSSLSFIPRSLVCFDARKAFSLGISKDRLCYDIKLLYKHDEELSRLVKKQKLDCSQDFFENEGRFSSHTKAIREARIDIESNSLKDLVPDNVRIPYLRSRMKAISELWSKLSKQDIEDYEKRIWPVFLDILKVEESKIAIDEKFVEKTLAAGCDEVHIRRFFEHIQTLTKDGFTKTKISPVGSRTWRFRVEGGFNCMAIPHGKPREAIVSRWKDGKIFTLDFNAIDYRCLIKAVDDDALNDLYEGQKDFHMVTAGFFGDVTKKSRDISKKITYAHIYGGAIESLMKLTLMSRDDLTSMTRILDSKFSPIATFRKNLASEARSKGYLVTPGGHRVEVFKDDHDGKIVGLYAQTYSSSILIRALNLALEILSGSKSCVIFTVHDEIVIDAHPDDYTLVKSIVDSVMQETGFVMKLKEGKNYGEATA